MPKLSWASHLEMMLLLCLSSGRKELVNGKTFRLTEGNSEPAAPIRQFRFNREHFHYPVPHDNQLVCKVHVQRVDTHYSCAICGVSICPDPCFHRYHNGWLPFQRWNSPRRLSEGCGRPSARGRPRQLCRSTEHWFIMVMINQFSKQSNVRKRFEVSEVICKISEFVFQCQHL